MSAILNHFIRHTITSQRSLFNRLAHTDISILITPALFNHPTINTGGHHFGQYQFKPSARSQGLSQREDMI